MAPLLLPHQARYSILGPGGEQAGTEALEAARFGDGTRIRSSLTTDFPARLEVAIDWELDAGLVTRRLLVQSRNASGYECELELTVTGNGLLAHRVAPDGPTQVEMGWGPDADLDHISAGFATVLAARTEPAMGRSRRVDTVYIAPEDLLPEVVTRELTWIGGDGPGRLLVNRAIETGHEARMELDPSGALRSYEGLLRLDWLSLGPAATK